MAEEHPQMIVRLEAERLSTLCCDLIAQRLTDTIARDISKHDLLELREGLGFLPTEICTDIMSTHTAEGLTLTDKVLHLFRDRTKATISSIDLSSSQVTDWSLQWLAQHTMYGIDISGCNELSAGAIQEYVAKMAPTLRVLMLGTNSMHLFKASVREARELLNPNDMEEKAEVMREAPCETSGSLNNNWFESSTDNVPLSDEEQSADLVRDLPKSLGLHAPNLHTLSIHSLSCCRLTGPNSPLTSLAKLQHLDLTGCVLDLENADCLHKLPLLSTLVLHQTLRQAFDLNCYLPLLTKLTSLQHLDISVLEPRIRQLRYPSVSSQNKALQTLLKALPLLYSLDISGTHLGRTDDAKGQHVGLPGLAGRHFEFLGLFNCVEDPCARPGIPAERVTGTSSIAQVIESLKAYQKRPSYCDDILTSLHHMVRDGLANHADPCEMLTLVCDIMRVHSNSKDRQVSGSATLFYLLKSNGSWPDSHLFAPARLLRRVARVVYNAMDNHFGEKSMLRNGLLTLCHLEVPEDVMFMFKDMVTLLLLIVRQADLSTDGFLQRLALHLINRLMRGDDKGLADVHKKIIGDQGAIKILLWLIKSKLSMLHDTDEVLDMAWSTLWNVTDETPENCRRFVYGEGEMGGLELFYSCYIKFNARALKTEANDALLRNMIGVLGNIAEVDSVRSKMIKPAYLGLFRTLLQTKDEMEVSYHAAGIICHILADQQDTVSIWTEEDVDSTSALALLPDSVTFWMDDSGSSDGEMETGAAASAGTQTEVSGTQTEVSGTETEVSGSSDSQQPPKEPVLQDLVEAMARWELTAERCINYRSFNPILKLVQCQHTIEVRQWAVWALCNLTTICPTKYCKLLQDEGGIKLLQDMMSREQQAPAVLKLMTMTLQNCKRLFNDVEINSSDDSCAANL